MNDGARILRTPTRAVRTLTARLRRPRDRRGQALPFFVIVLPGLLVVLGLGLDGGNLFLQRRAAQAAADLAALSGARFLPGDAAGATTRAQDVATLNGWGTGAVVRTPYNASPNHIEVVVTRRVPTFLLGLLGIVDMPVTARAVARNQPSTTGGYAIYAGRSSCGTDADKTLDWSGSNVNVTGRAHSNDGVLLAGSTNRIQGPTTYSCVNKFRNTGGGNQFNPAPARVTTQPWPVTYTASQFACTYPAAGIPYNGVWDLSSNGPWWVGGSKSSKVLRPGVYCATGSDGTIKLSDSDISGNVTFVATYQIEISGSNFNLTPFANGVLFYSQGTSDVALKLSGSGGTWQGLIYAPNGKAEVSGSSNLTISGGIVARDVKINGSSFSISGTVGATTTPYMQLVD